MKKCISVVKFLVFVSELLISVSFVGAAIMVLTSNGRYRFHTTADVVVYGIMTIGVIMQIVSYIRKIVARRNKRTEIYSIKKMSW